MTTTLEEYCLRTGAEMKVKEYEDGFIIRIFSDTWLNFGSGTRGMLGAICAADEITVAGTNEGGLRIELDFKY